MENNVENSNKGFGLGKILMVVGGLGLAAAGAFKIAKSIKQKKNADVELLEENYDEATDVDYEETEDEEE
jgi:hypothetical protein